MLNMVVMSLQVPHIVQMLQYIRLTLNNFHYSLKIMRKFVFMYLLSAIIRITGSEN